MISDTLHDAVSEIDRYLQTAPFVGVYGREGDPLYDRIAELRDEMEAMRAYLDNPHATPFAHGSGLTAAAEMRATLFLVGLGTKMSKRDEQIAHNAYVCGWLEGIGTQAKKERA